MASLDIDSLLTNIPLDETINICVDLLFKEDKICSGWNEKDLSELLLITLKESVLPFGNKYYCQVDVAVKRSTLGLTLANIFCVTTELFALKDAPRNSDRNMTGFVDYIIVVFEKPEHLQQLAEHINKQHPNSRFSVETEKNGALPFLKLKYIERMEHLLPVCAEKKLSVVCTQWCST